MASQDNLNELYARFLRNECTPGDIRLLTELFGSADDETLHQLVEKQLAGQNATTVYSSANEERYERIFNNLQQRFVPARPAKRLWTKISVAASIIIMVGIAGYLFIDKPLRKQVIARQKTDHDIKPGGDKAYLILSDGRNIALNGQQTGLVGKDAGQDIVKSADGKIEYVNRHNIHSQHKVAFNILRTPNGGHYKLVLADGTKVWLNAASQIKYPTDFKNAHERTIELTGEAYFEVAKDAAHPFVVNTNDQRIRVLGTHFNVNAYHDDGGSKTTLLEGSIKAIGKFAEAIIKPGQQVVTGGNGKLYVAEGDTELAVAWKNDQFIFESEPVRSLMKNVARWYDVEVFYSADVPDVRFNGSISKFEDISTVLKILENTGKLHFEASGHKIYVTK